jgi:hypothetical protein
LGPVNLPLAASVTILQVGPNQQNLFESEAGEEGLIGALVSRDVL